MSNPFPYVKDIFYHKKYLFNTSLTESEYNEYLINKALSFSVDTCLLANEMNISSHIPKKMQHDFYFYGIDKGFREWTWVKDFEFEKIKILQKYYKISYKMAKECLDLLTEDKFNLIKETIRRMEGMK